MTPAQRETLETMAATTEATPGASRELLDAAAAIRAALAEVDRLNATADRLLVDCEFVRAVASKALGKADAGGDEAHLVGLVVDRLRETERERDAIRDENDALHERVGVLSAAEHEAHDARVVVDRQRHVALAENDALRAEVTDLRSRLAAAAGDDHE